VRIQLLKLIGVCLNSDSFLFVPLISDTAIAISKVLTDSNPEMKEAAAEFIIEFSLAL
jgi:hypothetical protein